MRRRVVIVLALLLAASVAYLPLWGNDFVDLDDADYIRKNPNVNAGLTLRGVGWALTATRPWTWHPLTWMSHMADVSLYGLDPRGHHATSLLLHGANAACVFLLLHGLTGWLWRSAGAAALLALHPIHVEAVAWASERKGMLSSFFFLLALLAWLRYVRRPGAGRYCLAAAGLAAALMAKQMAVTLPLLLLALDYWPLGRLLPPGGPPGRAAAGRRLLAEKLPLLALSAAAAATAYLTQLGGGAVMDFVAFPLEQRLGNAALSYFGYLGALFWPARLAIFYVHPQAAISWVAVAAACAAIAGAAAFALVQARRRPWLLTGLCWYLISLVPVLGIVQLGWHARADRYAYLPFIVVYLVLLATCAPLAQGRPWRRGAAWVAAAVVLGALGAATWRQAGHWKNDVTLFEHAIAVTGENWFAESNLGAAWIKRGRMDLGIPHWRAAVRLKREFAIIGHRK